MSSWRGKSKNIARVEYSVGDAKSRWIMPSVSKSRANQE
jgi:hypothetical protein